MSFSPIRKKKTIIYSWFLRGKNGRYKRKLKKGENKNESIEGPVDYTYKGYGLKKGIRM